MSETTNLIPANENTCPFLRADTALTELYRVRREVAARDTGRYSFEQRRQHAAMLSELDACIAICLSKY